MPATNLPDDPRDVDFEEYVAAVCQAAGLFVELNLLERETVDLLQLDVLTTAYDQALPILRLIEAKSGKNWGSTDIFKVRGAMHHLRDASGAFVVREDKFGLDIYKQLAEKMGIIFVHAPDCQPDQFSALVDPQTLDENDIWAWRFCYWVQRKMLDHLRDWRKTTPGVSRFDAVLQYAFEITSGIFFTSTVADRVERLYDAFGRNRNISARCSSEIEGGQFADEVEKISTSMFTRTFYKCEYNVIHQACWVEHQSRLALLKAAVDYQSYMDAGEKDRAANIWRVRIGGTVHEFPSVAFPNRFDTALDEIRQEPHFRRYPLVWQWFLGAFGGFILLDYEDREYELLAQKAGIPVAAIPDAFAAYDKLYPVQGGWFAETPNTNIRLLKLYSGPLRGIGANYRRILYSPDQTFDRLALTGQYTRNDLVEWNNMAVRVLTS
jgi:hypothetical protein